MISNQNLQVPVVMLLESIPVHIGQRSPPFGDGGLHVGQVQPSFVGMYSVDIANVEEIDRHFILPGFAIEVQVGRIEVGATLQFRPIKDVNELTLPGKKILSTQLLQHAIYVHC